MDPGREITGVTGGCLGDTGAIGDSGYKAAAVQHRSIPVFWNDYTGYLIDYHTFMVWLLRLSLW